MKTEEWVDDRHLFWTRVGAIAGVLGVLAPVAISLISSKQQSVVPAKVEAQTTDPGRAFAGIAPIASGSPEEVSREHQATLSPVREDLAATINETANAPQRRKPPVPAFEPTPLELEYRGE